MLQSEEKKEATGLRYYRLNIKIWPAFCNKLAYFINRILNFFSLRKTERFWGIVYDSVSKQPLDPVIVKLLYADGREIETCVTDISGRYGFLARPGKFKIYARKTNYAFPSAYIGGSKDGIFENIYHGEFFILNENSEVVAPNIPMDPVTFDWNQQAKKGMGHNHPYLKLFFKKIVSLFFWFGFILVALSCWKFFPKIPLYIYGFAIFYLGLIFLAQTLAESRLWGEIILKVKIEDMQGLFLELHNVQFKQVSFGKAIAHDNGRFLLRANRGKYLLTVSKINQKNEKILLGSLPVKIGSDGVVTSAIEIRENG